MKKVLIISYFYPPGNFAGSYRVEAWAKYLNKFGYHPIVVTRHWRPNDTNFTSIADKSDIIKEQNSGFTVYRIPFNGYKSDQLRSNYGSKLNLLWRIISFFQILLEFRFILFSPARGLYYQAKRILIENDDLNIIITSGRPFFQFKFAYELVREFPNVKWIADYRDPWNSNTNIQKSIKRRLLRLFEKKLERKLLKSACCFTTCSDGIKENIQDMFSFAHGHVVTNGFDDFNGQQNDINTLRIAYIGSLYDNQLIERFLIPLTEVAKSNEVHISFYGLYQQKKQTERVKLLLEKSNVSFQFHDWIEKSKLLSSIPMYNVFLLCGIPSRRGTYTAKFFDYLSFQKNIVLCPSDNDVLEKTIIQSQCGWVLKDEQSVKQWYSKRIRELQESGRIEFTGIREKTEFFKYENQVQILSKILDEVSNN